MRVFITGVTGFIGRHVARELIAAGHEVVGLARSSGAAAALAAMGAGAHGGDLEDLDGLRRGATASDAVIHLGFDNDFSRFGEVCAIDRAAIEALGAALVGSGKPLVVPNGIAGLAPHGRTLTEDDDVPDGYPFPRASEQTALRLASRGVAACVVRLPQVHDTTKLGLVTRLLDLARSTGVSAYVGEGATRWAAAHVSDVARLFRLVLESPRSGTRYHAVAEGGVPVRVVADTIGRALSVPATSLSAEEARRHFGPLSMFVGQEMSASADVTRRALSWHPVGPTLVADLERAAATRA